MAASKQGGERNQGQQPKPGRQSVPEYNSEAQAEGRREIPPMSHVPQWSRTAAMHTGTTCITKQTPARSDN